MQCFSFGFLTALPVLQAPQMVEAVSAAVERVVSDGSVRADDGEKLLQSYSADLAGYTYLSS